MIFSLLAMGENDLSQHDRPTLPPKRQLYRILQLEVEMYNVESRVLGAMIESYWVCCSLQFIRVDGDRLRSVVHFCYCIKIYPYGD